MRPGFRAAMALAFGVFAPVNGALHLIHVTDGGASGSDVTGVLALAAGVVLALIGLAIPFVHRGEGAFDPKQACAFSGASNFIRAY
jgi:hypothetical protein